MEAAYSNVAGELVGALFTNDPAVLDVPIRLMNAIGLLVSLREMVSELGGAASRSARSSVKKTRAAGDERAARTNVMVPIVCYAGARSARSLQPGAAG